MSVAKAHRITHTKHFEISLDAKTGAIQHLVPKASSKSWASPDHPLALFTYQTLTQADYTAFLAAYVLSREWWAPQDFGKPNIEKFPAESRIWTPTLLNQWEQKSDGEHRIMAELGIEDAAAQARGLVAWPQSIWLEIVLPDSVPVMQLTLQTFGKVANRMPEAMWLTFRPQVSNNVQWNLEKVNQQVSPLDVIRGGASRMHAVTGKFTCHDGADQLEITTLDAPTVAFTPESPLNFSQDLPDLRQEVHVGLYNNAWGTNYPQWAAGDWKYRFTLAG